MVDHWPIGSGQHRTRGFKTIPAKIGIADAVEDEIVTRQRNFRIGVFRHQDGGLKFPIAENGSRRYVAARRRDQEQDRDRRTVPAIGQRRQKVVLERFVVVPAGARRIANFSQQITHSAMRMDMIGIDPQRGFEMKASLLLLATLKQ